MSNEPLRSKQHAQRDLNFIRALREADAFQGYFLRRLKDKRDKISDSFRNDGPEKVDKDQREALRRILQEYDWIIETMMADDEAACRAILMEAPHAASRQGQGQAGMG